jgi:GT2 family glycosyltransferase
MGGSMELSIIIVNYRTYDLTKKTIDSVINKKHPFSYEIYLIDNASNDGSLEKLQKDFSKEKDNHLIKFIANKENKGFAYANNIAMKKSSANYVLLLNSDTIVLNNCLEKCLNYIKSDNKIGALGCKVLLPNGGLDKACRRSFPDLESSFYRMIGLSHIFPEDERFGKYNLAYLDENEIHEIDCLTGAFILIRSKTINQVGLLDEKFFMYGEDIDWCYRIKSLDWKIIYYGEAEIIHYKGSSNKEKNKLIYEFYRSMQIFYNEHYKDKNHLPINAVIYLGIWSMFGLKLFLNLFRKST